MVARVQTSVRTVKDVVTITYKLTSTTGKDVCDTSFTDTLGNISPVVRVTFIAAPPPTPSPKPSSTFTPVPSPSPSPSPTPSPKPSVTPGPSPSPSLSPSPLPSPVLTLACAQPLLGVKSSVCTANDNVSTLNSVNVTNINGSNCTLTFGGVTSNSRITRNVPVAFQSAVPVLFTLKGISDATVTDTCDTFFTDVAQNKSPTVRVVFPAVTPPPTPPPSPSPKPTGPCNDISTASSTNVRSSALSQRLTGTSSSGARIHYFPPANVHTGNGRLTQGSAAGPYPTGEGQLLCHGGPVQTTPKVYLVFWGSAWNNTTATGGDPSKSQAYLIAFFQAVGGSKWANVNTQYYDPAHLHVGNPTNLYQGSWNDTTAVPTAPGESDIAGSAARAAAHFGDTTGNAQYIIALPKGIRPNDGFNSQYCAWHSYVNTGGKLVAYTNLPYLADTSINCGANRHGNINDGVSIVAGHEFAETVTDPFVNAWYDIDFQENGDKCAWYHDGLNPNAGGFATQPLWSNLTPVTQDQCIQAL
jgi:hypothetical protein